MESRQTLVIKNRHINMWTSFTLLLFVCLTYWFSGSNDAVFSFLEARLKNLIVAVLMRKVGERRIFIICRKRTVIFLFRPIRKNSTCNVFLFIFYFFQIYKNSRENFFGGSLVSKHTEISQRLGCFFYCQNNYPEMF